MSSDPLVGGSGPGPLMSDDPFAGASSLHELVARVTALRAGEFPETVWQGAALARMIDADLYQRLAGNVTSAPPFTEFVANSETASVSYEAYTLRDTARERILLQLSKNSTVLRRISTQILSYAVEHKDPLEQFAQRIVVDPSAAENEFDRLYGEADGRFDLSRCDALLDILRQRAPLLTPGLREKLASREQYLASRLLFIDEFYRTASYLEHGDLLSSFASFVAPGVLRRILQGQWLLNIHGKGGAGKTMFLRWVIARHCIPENSSLRVPVARLDLDFIYRALLIRQPWLALLSIAAQLRSQLPGAPFANLAGPEETALRNLLHNRAPAIRAEDEFSLVQTGALSQAALEDKFCRGLGEAGAVLVFDTVEELSLHHPAVLPRAARRPVRPISGVRQETQPARTVGLPARAADGRMQGPCGHEAEPQGERAVPDRGAADRAETADRRDGQGRRRESLCARVVCRSRRHARADDR
jgi:hypothetical protein